MCRVKVPFVAGSLLRALVSCPNSIFETIFFRFPIVLYMDHNLCLMGLSLHSGILAWCMHVCVCVCVFGEVSRRVSVGALRRPVSVPICLYLSFVWLQEDFPWVSSKEKETNQKKKALSLFSLARQALKADDPKQMGYGMYIGQDLVHSWTCSFQF